MLQLSPSTNVIIAPAHDAPWLACVEDLRSHSNKHYYILRAGSPEDESFNPSMSIPLSIAPSSVSEIPYMALKLLDIIISLLFST